MTRASVEPPGWAFSVAFPGDAVEARGPKRYNSQFLAAVAQLVERNLAKVEVESSRLFCRSRFAGEIGDPVSPVSLGHSSLRRGGRVVMQRPAKPCTPVRFRSPPPIFFIQCDRQAHVMGLGACGANLFSCRATTRTRYSPHTRPRTRR